ncbi:MAG: hypothetical protein M3Y82_04185 [Verrucomicrobiota bacterium]|nr:hypothetical protein [Verrucomicrobiota bacterium]
MSTATIKTKTGSAKLPDLNKHVAQAKAVLRQLRDTLEELEDRRDLAKAKKKNNDKPGSDWEQVKKELGFEF